MDKIIYPKEINIYEVGPRDGLQNEKTMIPLEVKVDLINRLSLCNLKEIEIGAFVSSKWVPQMKDSIIIDNQIKKKSNVSYPILVPNLKGLEIAIENKVSIIIIFLILSPYCSSFCHSDITYNDWCCSSFQWFYFVLRGRYTPQS